MEVVLARHPHARQAGEVIDLVDVIEGSTHDGWIEHRTLDVLRPRRRPHRRPKIENAHAAISCEECDEMLSDEAAAARDERLLHGRWPPLARAWRGAICSAGLRTIGSRSGRSPSATYILAKTNIGLMSMCIGLSRSAGQPPSKYLWPKTCIAQPMTKSAIAMVQTQATLACAAIKAAISSSGTALAAMANPIVRSSAIQNASAGRTSTAAALV